ncbi:MAG: hypothetical protein WAT09_13605 [Paracoccaceae bacterium]
MGLWIAMVGFLAFNDVLDGSDLMAGVFFIGGPIALVCGALHDIRRRSASGQRP